MASKAVAARRRRLAALLIGAAAAWFAARVLLAYPRVAAEAAAAAPAASAAATIAPLLGPADFAALGDRIGADFGVTGDGVVAFAAGGALHALAPGGRVQTIDLDGDPPESFVVDANGPMLGIADGYLGLLGEDRRFGAARPLPEAPMRLAPSVRPGVFYLSGGAAGDYRLYRFIDDGTLQLLMGSREPIVDAADSARDVYAATASEILRFARANPRCCSTRPTTISAARSARSRSGRTISSCSRPTRRSMRCSAARRSRSSTTPGEP